MKKKFKTSSLEDSFNFALTGIFTALKVERNMKFHAIGTFLVILLTLFFNVSKGDLLILSISIALVWITELINTAIEDTVDIICKNYNPLAKRAKDIAAGAVLIAVINSLIVGYIIFGDSVPQSVNLVLDFFINNRQNFIFILLAVIVLGIFIIKSFFNHGSPLKGGMPSGHSALAGSIWMMLFFFTKSLAVLFLASILLSIVLHARVAAKIHSLKEVFLGLTFGIAVTYLFLVIYY